MVAAGGVAGAGEEAEAEEEKEDEEGDEDESSPLGGRVGSALPSPL